MYRVAVAQLQPGMRVGRSVLDGQGRILLTAGTVIKESYIDQLQRQGIPAIYIWNELAPDVEPPEIVSDQSRQALAGELRQATQSLKQALVDRGKAGMRRWAAMDASRLRGAVAAVVDEIVQNRRALVHLQDIRAHDEYTLGHSVNVCILSTLIGTSMNYDVGKLRELGLGAVLHDIGKVTVPDEILNKPGILNADEQHEMKQHAARGFDILRQNPEISFHVAHVAWQHHERWAGGGYPRALRGRDIHEYARVVAVADVYDAMTADRVYRKGYSPDRAMRNLLEVIPDWFEPRILQAFVDNIAAFPVGSLVELNTGEAAVVLAVARGQADRPQVRVVKDAHGRVLSRPYVVDLAVERGYSIARPLGEAETADLTPDLASAADGGLFA